MRGGTLPVLRRSTAPSWRLPGRLLAGLLLMLGLFLLARPVAAAAQDNCAISFADLQPDDAFYGAVTRLACAGIVSGYADGTFRPANAVTRAQLSKMLVIAFGWPLRDPPEADFSDVPNSGMLSRYIATALALGIIHGYPDGTFRPNQSATRAEVSQALVQALGWPPCSSCAGRFSDVPPGSPYSSAIDTAAGRGLLDGYPDGTFRPTGVVSRGEFSRILDALTAASSTSSPPSASRTPAPGSKSGPPRAVANPTAAPQGTPPATRIYWGAYIHGSTYESGNAPWDSNSIDRFEQNAGKRISILHWGQPWRYRGSLQRFATDVLEAVRQRGAIPLIDWAPWDPGMGLDQPEFRLRAVASGKYDDYIRQWASAARKWGYPFFLRFGWEMNGDWFPWSERANDNAPGDYVRAWRHVHDIFSAVGATNVTWVWCVNTEYSGSAGLENLYPGDDYVDWTGIDGYNWGPGKAGVWKSFYQVFKPTYDRLTALAPAQPVLIGETSSTELGGSKADWISDGLTRQLPISFPRIKALVWMNWNVDGMDWVIESSASAQAAFAAAIGTSNYLSNDFAALPAGPITPP